MTSTCTMLTTAKILLQKKRNMQCFVNHRLQMKIVNAHNANYKSKYKTYDNFQQYYNSEHLKENHFKEIIKLLYSILTSPNLRYQIVLTVSQYYKATYDRFNVFESTRLKIYSLTIRQ